MSFVWKHDKEPTGKDNIQRRYSDTDSDSDGIDLLDKRADDPLEIAATNDDIGDEFMAVRPWLGAVVAPTNAASMKVDSSSPHTRLELERVHGYQAQTASNNARYDSNGKVVYHTAALGVVFDRNSQRQAFSRVTMMMLWRCVLIRMAQRSPLHRWVRNLKSTSGTLLLEKL